MTRITAQRDCHASSVALVSSLERFLERRTPSSELHNHSRKSPPRRRVVWDGSNDFDRATALKLAEKAVKETS